MTDVDAQQQLLQHIYRRLTNFTERFDVRFDGLDREMKDVKTDLREVKRQTTATNGRVNLHDTQFAVMTPRLDDVIGDVRELTASGSHSPERLEDMLQKAVSSITAGLSDMKGKVTIQAQTGDERRLTKWDAITFTAGGASVWALIKFIEWAFHSLKGAS